MKFQVVTDSHEVPGGDRLFFTFIDFSIVNSDCWIVDEALVFAFNIFVLFLLSLNKLN